MLTTREARPLSAATAARRPVLSMSIATAGAACWPRTTENSPGSWLIFRHASRVIAAGPIFRLIFTRMFWSWVRFRSVTGVAGFAVMSRRVIRPREALEEHLLEVVPRREVLAHADRAARALVEVVRLLLQDLGEARLQLGVLDDEAGVCTDGHLAHLENG